MRYRLVRLIQSEVVLDERCIAPNIHGCNKAWLEAGPNRAAFLIEYRQRTPEMRYEPQTYYILKPKGHVTWESVKVELLRSLHPYFSMLELTESV